MRQIFAALLLAACGGAAQGQTLDVQIVESASDGQAANCAAGTVRD